MHLFSAGRLFFHVDSSLPTISSGIASSIPDDLGKFSNLITTFVNTLDTIEKIHFDKKLFCTLDKYLETLEELLPKWENQQPSEELENNLQIKKAAQALGELIVFIDKFYSHISNHSFHPFKDIPQNSETIKQSASGFCSFLKNKLNPENKKEFSSLADFLATLKSSLKSLFTEALNDGCFSSGDNTSIDFSQSINPNYNEIGCFLNYCDSFSHKILTDRQNHFNTSFKYFCIKFAVTPTLIEAAFPFINMDDSNLLYHNNNEKKGTFFKEELQFIILFLHTFYQHPTSINS